MKVSIYTDGAARGNPDGPGGYGVVLEYVFLHYIMRLMRLFHKENRLGISTCSMIRHNNNCRIIIGA